MRVYFFFICRKWNWQSHKTPFNFFCPLWSENLRWNTDSFCEPIWSIWKAHFSVHFLAIECVKSSRANRRTVKQSIDYALNSSLNSTGWRVYPRTYLPCRPIASHLVRQAYRSRPPRQHEFHLNTTVEWLGWWIVSQWCIGHKYAAWP